MRRLYKPRTQLAWACAVIVAFILTLILFRESEPSYGGKTITQWLYIRDPDFVWIPNDVYGHIHNELWEKLVSGEAEPQLVQPTHSPFHHTEEVEPAALAVQKMGTNAIPYLLRFVSAKPTYLDRLWNWAGPKVPSQINQWMYKSGVLRTAERYHYAGLQGFCVLGSNAAPALPALGGLLERSEAGFELGCSIAAIGSQGRHLLVKALGQGSNSRRIAAFCLGECPAAASEAIPPLLALVEGNRADYQVLGAIGRLGGPPELVVPVVTRFLERPDVLSRGGIEGSMAILILGLFGEKAQSSIPVLVGLYPDADLTTRQVLRVAMKHIQPDLVEALLKRAPNKEDDEDPWWNGAKN